VSGFREHRAQAPVYLGLEWLERNTLPIYADIPIFLVFGDDAVSENLAVRNQWHTKELALLNGEQHLYCRQAANVTVDADKVHVAIVRESRLEEVGTRSHEGHLESQYSSILGLDSLHFRSRSSPAYHKGPIPTLLEVCR
jgi:hypothetical protein